MSRLYDNVWQWTCRCSHVNHDDYSQTTFPTCGGCDRTFEWREVLSSDDIAEANDIVVREQQEAEQLARDDERAYWEVQGRRCCVAASPKRTECD